MTRIVIPLPHNGRAPGTPKTGGRQAGTGNHPWRQLAEAVRGKPLEAALRTLVDLAVYARSERIRLKAASELMRAGAGRNASWVTATLAELLRAARPGQRQAP